MAGQGDGHQLRSARLRAPHPPSSPDTRFFLSTRTLKYLPITAVALLLGTFHIPPQDRPAQRMACFKKAMRTLRATGESVLLTPEGTRVVDGKLGPGTREALAAYLGLDDYRACS